METKRDSLNGFIPASALIKTLAQQKRDLEIENLDLRREVEVLREDNKALRQYCIDANYTSSAKDITRICNALTNLWGQVGKKLGPVSELCEKMTELKGVIEAFVEATDSRDITDIDNDPINNLTIQ